MKRRILLVMLTENEVTPSESLGAIKITHYKNPNETLRKPDVTSVERLLLFKSNFLTPYLLFSMPQFNNFSCPKNTRVNELFHTHQSFKLLRLIIQKEDQFINLTDKMVFATKTVSSVTSKAASKHK